MRGARSRPCASASAGFLGGVAGIVLGILALLGVAPLTLLSVAVLVSARPSSRAAWAIRGALGQLWRGGTDATAGNADAGHIMVGIAAIVLGILAVVGVSQLTLVLVGLLCLGGGAFQRFLLGRSIDGSGEPFLKVIYPCARELSYGELPFYVSAGGSVCSTRLVI